MDYFLEVEGADSWPCLTQVMPNVGALEDRFRLMGRMR